MTQPREVGQSPDEVFDIVDERVKAINARHSPIDDRDIEAYLAEKPLNLRATLDPVDAYQDADYVIIATPTDYDPQTNYFNTRSVESVIADVKRIAPKAVMVIKSTIPVGFTEKIRTELETEQIFFKPTKTATEDYITGRFG